MSTATLGHSRRSARKHFNTLEWTRSFVRKNTVLAIAILLAGITSVIVPPDAEYISYFDFRTLTCLFCTLAVVCALKNIRFFTVLAQKVVVATGNIRMAVIALVCITFIGSMLIANDMALLTFLPLGYYVLDSSHMRKHMAFTFIMQNIAANLGGMLTPFGNPQNLYLYSYFAIPAGEFINIMLIPFAVSVILIALCCFIFVKPEKIILYAKNERPLPTAKTAAYLMLFALSIAIVFRAIPYWIGLIIIPAVVFVLDGDALKKVDYYLLFTFVAFFIFAGNMSRIGIVDRLISTVLEKNTLAVSALSCQVISNVPSSILLSRFTTDYAPLLMGVNIGGAGTLIASLASLITFREYVSHNSDVDCAADKKRTYKYIAMFSVFNFGFLFVLLVVCSLLV